MRILAHESTFADASFSSVQKTLLLFVIRDHVGATPLANLSQTLVADLTKIWDSLSKPEGLTELKLTDYFHLSFTRLGRSGEI